MTLSPASTTTHAAAHRMAWLVLAVGLALMLALSAQAARRGWPSMPAPRPAMPAPPALRLAPVAPSLAPVPAVTPTEIAAPAAGITGTIALPALPAAALGALSPPDLGITPARPFRLGNVGMPDRIRALECLTAAIYYEAASEPDTGQQAVAQVVLNRVRHPAFPATVCGVVYQGAQHAGCQFSFACDGSLQRRLPAAAGWARAARVAVAALAGRVYAPVGLATHYHTYAVTPAWNRGLVMTDVVGAHFFHRWKGWWGTAAAFRQLYAGGEPLPAPAPVKPGLAPAIVATAATVPPLPFNERPVTTAAAIQPGWRHSGIARGPISTDEDRLPAAPTVLEKWADSGRALR